MVWRPLIWISSSAFRQGLKLTASRFLTIPAVHGRDAQLGGSVVLDEEEDPEDGRMDNFSILWPPMSLQQQRGESSSSRSSPSFCSSKIAEMEPATVRSWGNIPLYLVDPTVHEIMEKERQWKIEGIEAISFENYVWLPVLDALGSFEGTAAARYYGGNQNIDETERLCTLVNP